MAVETNKGGNTAAPNPGPTLTGVPAAGQTLTGMPRRLPLPAGPSASARRR